MIHSNTSSIEQYDNDSWGHQWHGDVPEHGTRSSMTSIHNDTSGIEQYDNDSWWRQQHKQYDNDSWRRQQHKQYDNDSWRRQQHRAVWQWFMMMSAAQSSMTMIHDDISSTEQYDNDSWQHQQHRAVWQWFMTSVAQSSMTMIHDDISGTEQYANDYDISGTEQYNNDAWHQHYRKSMDYYYYYDNDSWHELTLYRTMPTDTVLNVQVWYTDSKSLDEHGINESCFCSCFVVVCFKWWI